MGNWAHRGLFVLGLLQWSGAADWSPTPPLPADTLPVAAPKPSEDNRYGTSFNRLLTRPFVNTFDLSYQLRRAADAKARAYNVDSLGEVPNSSWFTNRIGIGRMSLDDIAVGPNTGSGPDTTGAWLVVHIKKRGKSPGFTIQDANGHQYLIKFDPPGYPELATGAEMVTTKLLYAAGYNVAENYISVLDPATIRIAEGVLFRPAGRKPERQFTRHDLDSILRPVDRRPDGKIRVLASKRIPGILLGGFDFKGTRPDDANDLIPHEHRRELRGFYVIGSWINHWDDNIGNTVDAYDTAGGANYVKHYFVDLNSSLGSSTYGPEPSYRGHVQLFELSRFVRNFLTLGLYVPLWERYDTIPLPSVGAWESVTFDPAKYKFNFPTLAFEYMTDEDAYWAAKIVTSFTDEHLLRAAQAGQYSDPRAAPIIARVLTERRDKIGQYYFRKTSSLDQFELVQTGPDEYRLQFADLAAVRGIDPPASAYHLRLPKKVRANGNGGNGYKPLPSTFEQPRISFASSDVFAPDQKTSVLRLRTQRAPKGRSEEVRVFLTRGDDGQLRIQGIER